MAEWKKVVVSGSQAELNSLTLDTALVGGSGGTGLLQAALNAGSVGDSLVLNAGKTGFELSTDAGGDVTTAQLNASSSTLQSNIDGKQATVTGAATTITGADLTVSRALSSNASGKVAVATTTLAELNFVNGVTSAIQTQLDAKGAGDVTTAQLNASSSTLQSNIDGKQPLDSELTELATMASNTAAALADLSNTEVGVLDGASAGTVANSKAVVYGAAGEVTATSLSVTGNASVSGNLTVAGTASFQNAENLAVADKYILLNSGSSSTGDGGFVVQQATNGTGELFGYDKDSGTGGRWGVATAFNADTAGDFTPAAFMSNVVVGSDDTVPTGTYAKKGNIFIGDSENEIWIYGS
jgi:hypothetical protein